jgi:hypothetical protein
MLSLCSCTSKSFLHLMSCLVETPKPSAKLSGPNCFTTQSYLQFYLGSQIDEVPQSAAFSDVLPPHVLMNLGIAIRPRCIVTRFVFHFLWRKSSCLAFAAVPPLMLTSSCPIALCLDVIAINCLLKRSHIPSHGDATVPDYPALHDALSASSIQPHSDASGPDCADLLMSWCCLLLVPAIAFRSSCIVSKHILISQSKQIKFISLYSSWHALWLWRSSDVFPVLHVFSSRLPPGKISWRCIRTW